METNKLYLSELFDLPVTNEGNFLIREVLSMVFNAQEVYEFILDLQDAYPEIYDELTLEFVNGVPKSVVTPIGLVKLVMLLPTSYEYVNDVTAEWRDEYKDDSTVEWIKNLKETIANFAILAASGVAAG
jgi:hypothetical protein